MGLWSFDADVNILQRQNLRGEVSRKKEAVTGLFSAALIPSPLDLCHLISFCSWPKAVNFTIHGNSWVEISTSQLE
jgi:hypothetical protein